MGNCCSCSRWKVARTRIYGNGESFDDWRAELGKGRCTLLAVLTKESFGCNEYCEGAEPVIIEHRPEQQPWHHCWAGTCPDCEGKASWGVETSPGFMTTTVCGRCCGTGKVRHYGDGYIGEEKTRRHPKQGPEHPPCPKCSNPIRDYRWGNCPQCGHKLEPPAATEVIEDQSVGGIEAIKAMERKRSDATMGQSR
jgi:hypothetical protein